MANIHELEDIRDIEAGWQAYQENTEMVVPGEITFSVIEGAHPVKAWREYRQIKINELAQKAGISAAYLSQIENYKRNPTIDTLKAIAQALNIEVDRLI